MSLYDDDGNPIGAGAAPSPPSATAPRYDDNGVYRKVSSGDAFARGFGDSVSLGFGDELSGVAAGAGAAVQGQDFGKAYRERVADARERLRQAREDRPLATMAGGLAGGIALAPVAQLGAARMGLAGVSAAAGGRGLGALGRQVALGAGGGAVGGGLYGLGSGNDGDRLTSARDMAIGGAAFGGLAPAAFQGLGRVGSYLAPRPAMRTAIGGTVGGGIGYTQGDTDEERAQNALAGAGIGGGAAYSVPAVVRAVQSGAKGVGDFVTGKGPRLSSMYGGQTNSAIGIPLPAGGGGRQPPPEPQIPGDVVARIDDILGRQKSNPSQLESEMTAAQSDPRGRVLTDLLGDQGQAKTRALAQAPGQTGPMARDIAEERAKAQPGRILGELSTRLGVSKSPTQALASLNDEYARASRELYQPVLAQDVSPDALARLQPVLERIPPAIRDRANGVMERLIQIEGRPFASMSAAERIHMQKMALDDAIQGMERVEGLGATERAALRRLKGDFLRAVEGDEAAGIAPIIPGYREARQQWSSLADAQEAVESGAKVFQMRPEEIRAAMANMTPFEKSHFRVGAADKITARIMSRAREVGQANPANALNSTMDQAIIRELFDDPQQADDFLRAVNTENVLMRNAQTWGGGSSTYANAMQGGEELLSELANGGGPMRALGGRALRALQGGMVEQRNDRLGNALLARVDSADEADQQLMAALLRELRKREEKRLARGRDALGQGLTGTLGFSDEADSAF